jgi:hypothetical protein
LFEGENDDDNFGDNPGISLEYFEPINGQPSLKGNSGAPLKVSKVQQLLIITNILKEKGYNKTGELEKAINLTKCNTIDWVIKDVH